MKTETQKKFSLITSAQFYIEEATSVVTSDGQVLPVFISTPSVSPKAIALIVSGGGAVGADGDMSGPFVGMGYRGEAAQLNYQLRDHLCASGVATIRYGKRDVSTQSIPNLLNDVRIILKLVKERFHNTIPLILVGLSEGSLLSVLLAKEVGAHSLFLMSLPTRPIDDQLYYQFVEWPLHMLNTRVSSSENNELSLKSFENAHLPVLPIIGFPVDELPYDKKGGIAIQTRLRKIYEDHLNELMRFIKSPVLNSWYESLKELGTVHKHLEDFSGNVFVYQGVEDSQQNPNWLTTDLEQLKKQVHVEYFSGLGHCFAPMEGAIGHIKTSGPFHMRLLKRLTHDIMKSIL